MKNDFPNNPDIIDPNTAKGRYFPLRDLIHAYSGNLYDIQQGEEEEKQEAEEAVIGLIKHIIGENEEIDIDHNIVALCKKHIKEACLAANLHIEEMIDVFDEEYKNAAGNPQQIMCIATAYISATKDCIVQIPPMTESEKANILLFNAQKEYFDSPFMN